MKQKNAATSSPLLIGLMVLTSLSVSSTAQADTFSIVVLPDTQFYPDNNPEIFLEQTKWIKNNQQDENIVFVAHLGDIINGNCTSDTTEWGVADTAMETLDNEAVRYGISPGNHDWDPKPNLTQDDIICPQTTRNRYNGVEPGYENLGFGPARFASLGSDYGSQDGVTNDNNFVLFEFNGIEFIALNFAYISETGVPSTEVLNWADGLLANNPDRKAIVTSHYILEENNDVNREAEQSGQEEQTVFGPLGRAVFDRLKKHENFFLMLGGHRRGEAWRIEERTGMDDVHILLSNYQDYGFSSNPDYSSVAQKTCPPTAPWFRRLPGCGDLGLMRIMRFNTDINQVSVKTFAPIVNDPNGAILESGRLVDRADRGTTKLNGATASNLIFDFNFTRTPAAPLPPTNLIIN